jgi:precorrin-2 dehydrogenase/sirohydrochlorin ferrochelatase
VLPIVLDPSAVAAGLAGEGEGVERRRAMLAEAGLDPAPVASDGHEEALRGLAVLFIAGLPPDAAHALAARARLAGVLVNVEDMPALCDFHVPALVRRGDLLLTVSTAGRAPGLAKALRQWLCERFGPDWAGYTDEVAQARSAWRNAGHSIAEVSQRTRALVNGKGWLA